MTSNPSPFIQSEWMHGLAPVVLIALLAFAVGFVIHNAIAGYCDVDLGDDQDPLTDYLTHRGGNGHDA